MNNHQLMIVGATLLMWSEDIDLSRKHAIDEIADARLYLHAKQVEYWSRAVLQESQGGELFCLEHDQIAVFGKFCFNRLSATYLEVIPFADSSEEFSPRDPSEEAICLIEWMRWNIGRVLNGEC